jgi:flagellar motor switch protein FliN
MDDFIKLVENETVSTIEGLTGNAPTLSLKTKEDSSVSSYVKPPIAIVYVNVDGDVQGHIAVAITAKLATALADLMLAGEGESKDDMNDDDLDATKEIVSNIFGAISSSLPAQGTLPNMNFTIEDVRFFTDDSDINLSEYAKVYAYEVKLGQIDSYLMFIIDPNIVNGFNKPAKAAPEPHQNANFQAPHHHQPSVDLDDEELKNIGLILDVKLTIRVRIGSKRMLLKDVINMDIGSVVELNRLANDPLDILVDDKIIGKGEVVIVDGNSGIQITEIGSKRERLEKLRG